MSYSITTKERTPQPVLFIRKRVPQSAIAATLAESFGRIFGYVQQRGAALAGAPLARYVDWGPGMVTVEAGFPVVARVEIPEGSDVIAEDLPGGTTATLTHMGPYDKLPEAQAALQVWIESNGFKSAGAPWEHYITDPANVPDPKDWQTDIYWPVAAASSTAQAK